MHYDGKGWPWWVLFTGCVITYLGICGLLSGEEFYLAHAVYGGVYVPMWTRWFVLPFGILFIVISIYALYRGEGKERIYTEEEAARAKAELDAMYLYEYGELPKMPEKTEETEETKETKETKEAEKDA